ncbi:unnamed protein product [Owenia fusiformis]|uniref:RRM domain-containing protein n=1 Tax=Owenia fusiformis TaxID=6347 RepID=A0A8S4Q5R2_OWEFU|nr:unnamed protein product [Owenia fusiformis]
MSRIIVKNLPSGISDTRLRNIFSAYGHITDCSLKYTKDGVFRKFAFIGFQKLAEAEAAAKHFDKSFIDTSKLEVTLARDLGDSNKPRAWSKYSKDSSAFQRWQARQQAKEAKRAADEKTKKGKKREKKRGKSEKVDDLLGELKDDPEFQEFLNAHQAKSTKSTWSNDTVAMQHKGAEAESDSGTEMEVESVKTKEKETSKDKTTKTKVNSDAKEAKTKSQKSKSEHVNTTKEPTDSNVSDMDYLKKKSATSNLSDSDSESSSSDEDNTRTKLKPKKLTKSNKKSKIKGNRTGDNSDFSDDSSDDQSGDSNSDQSDNSDSDHSDSDQSEGSDSDQSEDSIPDIKLSPKDKSKKSKSSEKDKTRHVLKIRDLPRNSYAKEIQEFFKPIKTKDIKIPGAAKKKTIGVAYVEFKTEADLLAAMKKNKSKIGNKRIHLIRKLEETEESKVEPERPLKPWELKQQQEDEELETIAESGRLFLRNLPYVCKEEDIEQMFSKYGPLTETHLPVDKHTKKVMGFAFVTFMIPEHAVKAFSELDGTIFQGRMLHILPSKGKRDDNEITENMSYKKKQELAKKKQASSSHNWNTLFLGENVVADVMAEKYSIEKSQILDSESRQSLGVRMALGETQVVAETREFLIDHGVKLDAFSQAAAARSKTTILAKNLPAGTKANEIQELFSKYGTIGKLVLPPSGVTAIIEYLEPSEARAGFTNLAYSKFKHLPLYLEWAPIDVFGQSLKKEPKAEETVKEESKTEMRDEEMADKKESKEEESSDSEPETEPGSVVFVKNLNFDTKEVDLKEVFEKCGPVKGVKIAKKKDMKNPGKFLSMGYGFVEYKTKASADKSLKKLQHVKLDEHALELKISNRATVSASDKGPKKKQEVKKQLTSKILIRNIPFQATVKEVKELFKVFGELKTVRLPKKVGGTGTHRGFGFVDFLTKQDAKRAFTAMCHSTHLYGRRLVLEWADTEESVDQLRKKTADHFIEGAPTSKKLKKSALMEELKLTSPE